MSTWRTTGSVVAGYVLTTGLVLGGMALAWNRMGPDGAFRPGSWDVSPAWVVASLVVSALAAVAGGYLCAALSGSMQAPRLLAVVLIVLGSVYALQTLGGERPEAPPRSSTVTMSECLQFAETPVWIAIITPLLGAAGVMLGAARRLARAGIAAPPDGPSD